jgi:WD40 repeat protein
MNHEKILYLYSRALEDANFDAIHDIMQQVADDPHLFARLLELEAAYQIDLHVPLVMEAPPMIDTVHRSNGHYAIPQRKIGITNVVLRVAVLVLVIGAIVLIAQRSDSTDPNNQQPKPQATLQLGDGPVIGPDNADQLVQVRQFGAGSMRGALWSPDGSTIAIYGYGIWLYDAATLEQTEYFDTDSVIYTAVYSTDGQRIVTGNGDGTVRVFDSATGAEQLRIETHDTIASYIAISPDGQYIASAGSATAPIIVWDAVTGRATLRLYGQQTQIYMLKFSPDSQYLAASGVGTGERWPGAESMSMIRFWHIPDGEPSVKLIGELDAQPESELNASRYDITSFDFSPDGRHIIAAMNNATLLYWYVSMEATSDVIQRPAQTWSMTNVEAGTPPSWPGTATDVVYIGDTEWITIDRDRVVRVWHDEEMGGFVSLPEDPMSYTTTIDFNPVSQRLLVASMRGEVLLVDAADLDNPVLTDTLVHPSSDYSDLATTDTDLVIGATWTQNRIDAWNPDTAEMEASVAIPATDSIRAIAIHPVSGLTAVIDGHRLLLWHPGESNELEEAAALGFENTMMSAIGMDNHLLVYKPYTSEGQNTELWDLSTDPPVREAAIHLLQNPILYGSFDAELGPTGDLAAIIMLDRNIRLWNIAQNQELPALSSFSDYVVNAVFNADGSLLAAIDSAGMLIVWDTSTWNEVFYTPDADGYRLTFSPDGRLLLAGGDSGIRVWNMATQTQIAHIEDMPGAVYDIAFNPDGTWIATTGDDGLIRIWAAAP